MSNGTTKYYGLYKASVVNNIDPMQMGRILVTVPEPGGLTPSSWAKPCVPVAGKQSGLFVLPAINSGVWIMFEEGARDQQVWLCCLWG